MIAHDLPGIAFVPSCEPPWYIYKPVLISLLFIPFLLDSLSIPTTTVIPSACLPGRAAIQSFFTAEFCELFPFFTDHLI